MHIHLNLTGLVHNQIHKGYVEGFDEKNYLEDFHLEDYNGNGRVTYRWLITCNDGRGMVLSCVMVGSVIGFCYTVLFDCSRVLGLAKD